MAVPTRIFVGVFVFSLIVALMVVPFTLMVLGDYQPPASFPLVESTTDYGTGHKVALVLASMFAIGFVVASWRALLQGARRQRDAVTARAQSRQAVEVGGDGGPGVKGPEARRRPDGTRGAEAPGGNGEPPPGYH